MLRMWDIRDVRLAASQSRLEWLPGHEADFMANAWAVEATLIRLCLRLFRSGTSLYDTEVVAAGCPAATCIAEAQAAALLGVVAAAIASPNATNKNLKNIGMK